MPFVCTEWHQNYAFNFLRLRLHPSCQHLTRNTTKIGVGNMKQLFFLATAILISTGSADAKEMALGPVNPKLSVICRPITVAIDNTKKSAGHWSGIFSQEVVVTLNGGSAGDGSEESNTANWPVVTELTQSHLTDVPKDLLVTN